MCFYCMYALVYWAVALSETAYYILRPRWRWCTYYNIVWMCCLNLCFAAFKYWYQFFRRFLDIWSVGLFSLGLMRTVALSTNNSNCSRRCFDMFSGSVFDMLNWLGTFKFVLRVQNCIWIIKVKYICNGYPVFVLLACKLKSDYGLVGSQRCRAPQILSASRPGTRCMRSRHRWSNDCDWVYV